MGCPVSTVAKVKLPKVDTQKTEGFRAKMKLGRAIANQLDSVMSGDDVAAHLGISPQAVRKIECLALAKIALRMQALNFNEL